MHLCIKNKTPGNVQIAEIEIAFHKCSSDRNKFTIYIHRISSMLGLYLRLLTSPHHAQTKYQKNDFLKEAA